MSSLGQRPRTLICEYKAYMEILVPDALADQIVKDELQLFDINWGRLEAIDKNGHEYKIEGTPTDVDYSVPEKMTWKVEESWPVKKAKIEEAYRKRIERRLALSREKQIPYDLSANVNSDDEDIKIVVTGSRSKETSTQTSNQDSMSVPATKSSTQTSTNMVVPFTDSPLHGTTPAKQNH